MNSKACWPMSTPKASDVMARCVSQQLPPFPPGLLPNSFPPSGGDYPGWPLHWQNRAKSWGWVGGVVVEGASGLASGRATTGASVRGRFLIDPFFLFAVVTISMEKARVCAREKLRRAAGVLRAHTWGGVGWSADHWGLIGAEGAGGNQAGQPPPVSGWAEAGLGFGFFPTFSCPPPAQLLWGPRPPFCGARSPSSPRGAARCGGGLKTSRGGAPREGF